MIQRAESDEQILATFDVMRQLRPELNREDYVATVRRMMQTDNYHLASLLEGEARVHSCREVQLISRVHRQRTHRFYFREGFAIECFHFATEV